METIEADPPATVEARSPSRKTRTRTGLIVVGIVLVAAITGWLAIAASALGGVSVEYDAQPLSCDGADVGTTPSIEDEESSDVAVVVTDGATCELKFQVINDGSADVSVEAVTARNFAPGNPAGAVVSYINPNAPLGEAVEQDYRFALEGPITVPAGAVQTFSIVFTFADEPRIGRCSASGWPIPAATVTAWGQSRTVESSPHSLVMFQVGGFDECPF